MDVSAHYDLRGTDALRQSAPVEISSAFSSPYKFVENLIPVTKQRGVFLDLCCGTGIHSVWAAKKGYKVFGVDLSSRSIEAARKNVVGGDFFIEDALLFLDRPQKYDVIFISGSLYYFDLDQILPKIFIALNEGGRFVCVETFGSSFLMNGYRKMMSRFSKRRDRASVEDLLSEDDLEILNKYFPSGTVRFFDFLTLGLVVLPHFLLTPLKCFDFWLLNKLGLNRLSFKFVFWGDKPR